MPIISLTSYGPRLKEAAYRAISTLLDQTIELPVILYLDQCDSAPDRLKNLPGLRISEGHPPHRSYTKIIPALREYPDEIIITADDDLYYPRNWAEQLLDTSDKHPGCIIGHRAHEVLIVDGSIAAYQMWRKNVPRSDRPLLTGVAGILYPPNTLHSDVTNDDLYDRLCPAQDDIWLWGMALLQGTRIVPVPDGHTEEKWLQLDPGGKAGGHCLWEYNWFQGGNDIAISNLISHYPEILDRLRK